MDLVFIFAALSQRKMKQVDYLPRYAHTPGRSKNVLTRCEFPIS